MNGALMTFLILLIPGLLIFFVILVNSYAKKAKDLKEQLWDNAGYKATKNIDKLYIDENKKSWYVVGCSRVYKYSDVKYCQIIKHNVKRNTVGRVEVQVYINDPNLPVIKFLLLDSEVPTSSYTYHSAMNMAREIDIQFKSMKIFRDYSNKPTVNYVSVPQIKYSKVETVPNDYVVFDLETTGLNKFEDKIIEIGAIKYINGVETDRFQTYVNPQKHIPLEVTNINGISDKDVKTAPKSEKALSDFLNFIGKYPLIAYNSDFDMGFIQVNCHNTLGKTVENDVVDALPLAKEYLWQLPNKKLETVKQHFGLNVGSHNAIDDCIVTNHLYQYCKQFEDLKHKYVIPFPYNPQELSDLEVEYINTAVEIYEKNGISKEYLTLYKNSKLLSIVRDKEPIISFKLYGKLQYVLLKVSFVKFENECKTDIKHTASTKSEGNYTRVFTENPQQLWEFQKYIK